jgi:hypothetical protein
MTSRRITGEVTRRSIDRGQWSGLNRHRSDLILRGLGEGYVEELYFGKGFSTPPTFTYSAVIPAEGSGVQRRFIVPPRGSLSREVDSYGMGNDSQSCNPLIQDPGFESQGKYHIFNSSAAKEIVSEHQQQTKIWDNYDGAPNSEMYSALRTELVTVRTNEWGSKYQTYGPADWYGPSRWVQTEDVRERWALTNAISHDLGVGSEGEWSAEVTLGPSGQSNWLIPFNFDFFDSGLWNLPGNNPTESWRNWVSVAEESHTNVSTNFGGGIYASMMPPPYLGGFGGFAYVHSANPVELEVSATLSGEKYWVQGQDPEPRGRSVFPDSNWWPGTDPDDRFTYREIAQVDFAGTTAGGGKWSRVDIDLPYDGWRAYPDSNYCLGLRGEPTDLWWTLRFRVKGSPGEVVRLDNVYLDWNLRNSEVPILTVGVDEWIVDEAGVYIGARLWVKMATPTGDTCSRLEG